MVSVILPFYNPGARLKNAVESVLNQTVEINELLLINNNSDRESVAWAENCANKHPRVSLLHEKKQGVAHAMNCGLRNARSEWIARIDADDSWKANKLEKQWQFAKEHPNVQAIGTQVVFNSELEKSEGFASYVNWSNNILSPKDIQRNIYVESPLVNPSILFRKELIEQYGYYTTACLPEDYEMFLRWNAAGVEMGKVGEPLVVWNDSAGRLTRTHPAYTAEAFNQVKCQYMAEWLDKHRIEKPGVWIWGAGRKTRLKASKLEEFGIHIKGYIDLKPIHTLDKPCIAFTEIGSISNEFIVSFVSNRGKGQEIREYLNRNGRVEMEDFLLAG